MKRLIAFIFGFCITTILLCVAGFIFLYVTSPSTYNILVVGSDQRGTERARSDVLFLVSLPKDPNKKPFFLSIPRDTKVEDSEYGLQKMTHFYALGKRPDDGKLLGNIDLTQREVEELLNVHVDATVEVTFESFKEIVDELGGATVEGKKVDGEEALAIVRDRFSEGRSDFSRQADEREVVRSLMTKVKTPAKMREMMKYFDESDQARFQYSKMKLVRFGVGAAIARKGNVTIGEMEEASLPGTSDKIYTPAFGKELYYWIVNEEETQKIIDEHF